MDDGVPIHVEPGGMDGPGGAEGGGAWSGAGVSSRRVVHEPSSRLRLVAVLVVAGLVVGGLLSFRGGGSEDRPPPESADDVYATAIRRLGRAGSFSYRGTVQATSRSPLRPGRWLEAEVTVEGAVLLPHSITREVAVARDGSGAVETVTSGSTAWSRTASSRSGLPSVPWELVAWTDSAPGLGSTPNPQSFASRRLGIALVVDVVRAARNRRREPSDAGEDRTLHATVPIGGGHRVHSGDLLAGAEVTLELDGAGDINELTLTSAPDRADLPDLPDHQRRLVVELAFDQLGDPGLITAADVGRPARDALPLRDLAVAGVEPLELSSLPAGWALTGAQQARTRHVVMCGGGAGRCIVSDEGCPVLQLDYRDLTKVSGGWLSLSIMPETCFAGRSGTSGASGTNGTNGTNGANYTSGGRWAEPFRAGPFTGSVDESATTIGAASDGETTVGFSTDLPAADAAAVLATLTPIDHPIHEGPE